MRSAIAALVLLTFPAGAQEYGAHLGQIGVTPELHDTINGSGQIILNIDGYPDLGNADLYGSVGVVPLFTNTPKYSFRWSTNHATHAIGIMNGRLNGSGIVGVAPGAYVFNVPVWSASDGFAPGYATNLYRAYNYAVSVGATVVNREVQFARLSAGAYRLEAIFANGELPLLARYRNNFVIVQPAGNQGQLILNQPYEASAAATLSHLLIVGSVNGKNVLSSFSNRPGERCFYRIGATVCSEAEKLKNFFVVAPGDPVVSSAMNGGTSAWYGTSFAGPQVSGEVVLIAADAKSKNVRLTPTQLASIVKESATDLGAPGVDGVYGYGLINVAAALAPIGQLSSAVVPGQAVFDSFGRPYTAEPVASLLAPTTSDWSVMMMGDKQSLAFGRQFTLTSRQALIDDASALTMIGLERERGGVTIGLSAGALHETYTTLGMITGEPSMTRLGGVDAGIQLDANWSLSAFYMRGAARDFPVDTFGIGLSHGAFSVDLVKPLSIISANVPVGYDADGSLHYQTLPGARPWAVTARWSAEW